MKSLGLALLLGSLALAACAAAGDDTGMAEQNATPIDRLLLGNASAYTPNPEIKARQNILDASMVERRKMAWGIVQKAIAPVAIDAKPDGLNSASMPRFQTWLAREEILPMFDHLFRGLSADDEARRAPFSAQAIQDVFPWNVTRATSLASFTQERLDERKKELSTPQGLASLGKDQRVLMSPDYVQHLFDSYGKMLDCKPSDPVDPAKGAPLEPPTSEAFAPCLQGEFPAGAVAVKTRWMPSTSAVPVYDTSAAGLRARLANDTYLDQGDGPTAQPDPTQAYTMQLTPDATSRLVAFHIMTKELRDWVWITLWWSPTPNEDFGADRPAAITGAFANYKMCVVTAYDEKDKAPGAGLPKSLADAVDVANENGPATWCSNPYLETADHSAKTNCIGCHQNGGTQETTDSIIAQDAKFPDNARTRVRADFPADYAFTTEGGLELASEFRNRVEAVSPSPAAPPR